MPVVDVLQQKKKHDVMQDTWGHLYPESCKKYYGEMIVAIGQYGNRIIINSDFPGLESSPQRYAIEHSIFNNHDFDPGVFQIKCGMWFYKNSDDIYLDRPGGKLINVTIENLH